MKILLALLLGLSGALFTVASHSAKPVVLNVQNGEEIRHLDPQLASGIGSAHININLFVGLFEYNHKDGSPKKHLVQSFKSNEDSTVWTFDLKKDYHWVQLEKGKVVKKRPIDANDIVYSFRRILSPELASEYAYMLYVIKNGEAYNKGKIKDATKVGVKATGKYQVQVTLQGSTPSFISYLPHHSFTIVPKEPIEKHKAKWIMKQNIWTSGAFAFKDWKLKDKIILVKNPHYPEASVVQPEVINFKFIGTYSPEQVRAFKAGNIDIDMMAPPTSDISFLRKEGYLKVARQLGTYFVRVNINKKGLKDPRVRKALALTIPRKRIVKYVMKTGQIPTFSFVPDAFNGYEAKPFTDLKSYKKRVELAKKLLAEAGFPGGKGLPEIEYLYNTAETHQKVGVVIAKAWAKELGIKAKPLNQEWKVYLNSQASLDYDVSRAGWVADMEDPINFLEMFITDGGNNNTGWSNTKYDDLIRKARGERDLNKRNAMLSQAEEILMQELPVLPIFNYTTVSSIQKYVSGFHSNKLNQHALKYVKIDTAMRDKLYPGKN
jgi:oligopeptide transport system substrate-binding protein